MKRASLNHTYRLVWNDALAAFVAVAEHVRARGKRSSRVVAAVAGACTLFGLPLTAVALDPGALPTGGQIVAGQGSIAQQGNTMVVQQNSAAMIANWQSFNIGQGATVQFIQPSSVATALNRVLGVDPSHILGQLSANGRVFLINPNGVIFGHTARVDAAALVAGSLNISDADFLAGRYRFTAEGSNTAVSNLGELRASEGGFVALLGSSINNAGQIVAPEGQVALVAGDTVELALTDSGLLGVKVDVASAGAHIENSGFIAADGGRVWMTARQAAPMIATAINQSGVVRANSVNQRNGEIWLDAGPNGRVELAGSIQAQGQLAGTTGGKIVATGHTVEVSGSIDASGSAGGGEIYVGGGWQGKDPAIAEASRVYLQETASLLADARELGDGGTIVAWSAEQTLHNGLISARGAGVGASGGQVETSSRGSLGVMGAVDVSSPEGRGGEWLLDPENIRIVASSGSPLAGTGSNPQTYTATTASGTADVLASSIVATLNTGGNVTILASNDIDILADIAKTGGAASGTLTNPYQEFSTLTFQAGNNITLGTPGQSFKISSVNAASSPTVTRSLNVIFQGSGGAVATDTGLVTLYGEIASNGGNVSFYKPVLLSSTKPVATQVEAPNPSNPSAATTPDSGHVVFHRNVTLGGTGSVTIDTQSALDGSQNYLRRGGNVIFHGTITSLDAESPRDLIINTTGAISNSAINPGNPNANYSGSVTFNGHVGTEANPLHSLNITGPSAVYLNTDQINLRRLSGTTLSITAPGDYVSQLILGATATTIAVRGFAAGSADYTQNNFDIVAAPSLNAPASLSINSDRSIQIIGTSATARQILGATAAPLTVNLNPSQRQVSGSPANSGGILLQYASVDTKGGDINLASSAQRAFGVATEQNTDGVRIQASTLDSGGGDIAIYGNAASSSTTGGAAINIYGASNLLALGGVGTGNILIDGRVHTASGGANKDAVLIGNRGQATVRVETDSGMIRILGDASAVTNATVGASYNGVELTDAAMIRSVSGNIEITGKGGGGNNNNVAENYGIKLRNADTQIVSHTGNITLTGVTGGKTTSYGIHASGDDIAIGQERDTDTAKTPVVARVFTGNIDLIADTMNFVNNSSSRLRATGARDGSTLTTGQLNIRTYTDAPIQIGGTEVSPPSVPGNPLFLKSDWFSGSNAVFQAGFGEINIGGYGSGASTKTLTVAGPTTIRDPLNLLMTGGVVGNGGRVVISAPLTVAGASDPRTLNIEVANGVDASGTTSVDTLRLVGAGDFILSASNLINTLAVANSAGSVRFNNAQALTVGTVSQSVRGASVSTVGVTATVGDVTLSTTGATTNLVQADDISASGLVSLRAANGSVQQQAADTATTGVPIITADALMVSARDTSSLTNDNLVDKFAGRLTGASTQTLSFTSVDTDGIILSSLTDAAAQSINGLDVPGTVILNAKQGAITQTARASVGKLSATADGDIDLTLRNTGAAVNLVAEVAAVSQTGEIKLLNNASLIVGSAGSLNGLVTVDASKDISVATASGNLTLAQGVGAASNAGTVRLEASAGSITQPAANGRVVADNLLLRASNDSVLNQANEVNVFAAEITGAGQGLAFTNSKAFQIGGVTGVAGMGGVSLINAFDGVKASNTGNVTLKASLGNITQTQDVNVGGLFAHAIDGDVVLTRSTNSIGALAGGALAGKLDAAGKTFNVAVGGNLAIGTVGGQAGIATNAGTVILSAASGALSQTDSGAIVADNLAVRAGNSSALGSSNNDVETLAAAVTAADQSFVFTNKDGFTVGTVDSLNGVSTNGGNITLRSLDTAVGKDLILAQGVSTGGAAGDVTLQSVGGQVRASTPAGRVTARGFSVRAVSGVDLTQGNTVTTLAAATTAGDIAFNNTTGFVVGTVGDLSGLAAPGRSLLLGSNGGVTQQAGSITAAAMRVNAAGNVDMTSGSNRVGTIAATVTAGGDFRYRDAGSVTVGSVGGANGINAGGAVWVRTGADLTLAAPVTAQAAGNQALVLAATRSFTNQAGATALSAPNGRWLVYDDNPLLADRFGGMTYEFRRLRTWYDGYQPGSVAERGNGYITTTVLLDPDQAVRQAGGPTRNAEGTSDMNGRGQVDGLRWADAPLSELPTGPVPLVGLAATGLSKAQLPVEPLRVGVAISERFSVVIGDLLAGGVVISASLADGRPLPNWLYFDGGKGVLAGVLPENTAGATLVRLTVRMASGEQGEILLQLVAPPDSKTAV